jgi:hypothetical protein
MTSVRHTDKMLPDEQLSREQIDAQEAITLTSSHS